jgi:hypothetical protein
MSAALALKADAPPVDTHPYILVKPGPYTKPRYFKTFRRKPRSSKTSPG